MKSLLCMTTALVTSGFVLATGPAMAEQEGEQRIQIGIEGYFQQWGVAANQDVDGVDGLDVDTSPVDQKHNSEIYFTGSATLDDGLTIGVEVQLEANTDDGNQIDESYMFVETDDWGRIDLGDTDNAAIKLSVAAPNGGVTVNDGDLVGIEAFVLPDGFEGTNTLIDTTILQLFDDTSGKFNYFTPRIGGVQIGLSYIPQFEDGGDNNNSIVRTKVGGETSGPVKNGFAAGINYEEDFEAFGISTYAGYLFGQSSGADGGSDVQGVGAGLLVTVGGVEIGGSFAHANGDVPGDQRVDGHSFDVGAAYQFGPYRVGLTYMRGESDGSNISNSDQHLDQVVLSGTYTLGPGVDLVGGLFYYDADGQQQLAEANLAAGDGGIKDNEGYGLATGFKLEF